jgi:hypothetical protein
VTETPGTESFALQMSRDTRDRQRTFETRAQAQSVARPAEGGWAAFAVTILFMVAAFQIVDGFVALLRDQTYVTRENGLVVTIDYTVWGWVHLGLGVLAAIAAFGLLGGRMWARVVGVGMACLSVIVNFVFMPAYPFLSVAVIVLDILVVYAIVVYGGVLKDDGF